MATFIGAVGTYLIGKSYREGTLSFGENMKESRLGRISPLVLGTIPPVIANAVIVPFVLKYAYGVPLPIPLMVLTVGLGEVISCSILGTILGIVLQKNVAQVFK